MSLVADRYEKERGWKRILNKNGKITGFTCSRGHLISCKKLNQPSTVKISVCTVCKIDDRIRTREISSANEEEKKGDNAVSYVKVAPAKIKSVFFSVETQATSSSAASMRKIFCTSGHELPESSSNGVLHCFVCIQIRADAIILEKNAKLISQKDDICSIECALEHKFNKSILLIAQGKWCPLCSRCSEGERLVETYLRDRKIKYEREKRFEQFDKKARFDFFVQYKERQVIIEIDGEQHFSVGYYAKTEEDLKLIQERDRRKQAFAMMQGYRVIRINQIKSHFEEYVTEHMDAGLQAKTKVYYADPKLYAHLSPTKEQMVGKRNKPCIIL